MLRPIISTIDAIDTKIYLNDSTNDNTIIMNLMQYYLYTYDIAVFNTGESIPYSYLVEIAKCKLSLDYCLKMYVSDMFTRHNESIFDDKLIDDIVSTYTKNHKCNDKYEDDKKIIKREFTEKRMTNIGHYVDFANRGIIYNNLNKLLADMKFQKFGFDNEYHIAQDI